MQPTKDPRPIKDKSFQASCIHSILAFLTNNGFPGSPTFKTLTNPTGKDFELIFKFIYSHIDANYRISKFVDEVPGIIKALR